MSEVFGIACAEIAHSKNERSLKEQVQIFESLLLQSENNGGDASGVFFVERDHNKKSRSALFKIDLPSSKLIKRGEYIDLVQRFFGNGLRIAIGHCRKASTVAKTENKHNNHPILSRGVVGTHVGAITNHRTLWKEYGGNVNNSGKPVWQNGDVDSEIIFYLIGKQLRGANPPSLEGAIVEASKQLEGTYACAAVDLWRPGYVMLFTNQKKIYYYYSPSYNQVIFSTDFDILRTSLESAGFTILDSYENFIPAHSGLRIDADKAKLRPFVLASENVTEKIAKSIAMRQTDGVGA